jgi:lipopolysaccharide heptosyltransferase I
MGKIRFCKKILIIKPSSLGDVVHSLPFLNSIRTCFRQSKIHWLIARGLEGLVEGHPMIDKCITIDKDTWKRITKTGSTIREVRQLFRDLRSENYDLVVDLQGLLRSGIITLATRAPLRVGFTEAREGSKLFYTKKVSGGRNIHAVDRYMKIAESLDCDTEEIIFPFPLTTKDFRKVNGFKKAMNEYVVIVPGARWKTKIWPAENFGRVASMLPFKSLVVGSGSDKAIADRVVNASGGKALSVAGSTNLSELIAIIKSARFIIANDSGPMHIAAGFQVPVVCMFGPTSPLRTGPYGSGHIVFSGGVDCTPCFKKRCRHLKCMEAIKVESVYEKIRNNLLAHDA